MKKICNMFLLLICGGFFMLIALGSTSDSDNVDSSNYNTDKIYNIGEVLDCPSFDITIDKVKIKKKGTYIDSYQYISDPEWIGVILTVKNKSDETKNYYSSDIKLVNSTGEVIGSALLNYDIWGAESLSSPELISGGSKTGYIQFTNTNKDNSNLTLKVDCSTGLFNDDIIYKVNISQ